MENGSRQRVTAIVVAALSVVVALALARAAAADTVTDVCPPATPGAATCFAQVAQPVGATPFGGPSGLSPSAVDAVYGFPTAASAGAGETIAIVDAFDDPNAYADLSFFDSFYNLPLPQCGSTTPCFSKVEMTNDGTPPPASGANAGWAVEISLDIEWAHAIAPGASIMLVEADSNTDSDLLAAEQYASSHGAAYVSNSWGETEFSGETSDDSSFQTAGVSYFVASGDTGGQAEYPAASPDVVAVGGTSLAFTSGGGLASETAWSGSGGGCSQYESASAPQSGFSQYAQAGCAGKRAIPDLSLDGDPNSGVSVYDTANGASGWVTVGGTSAATPMVAAEAAAQGIHVTASSVYGSSIPFRDITSGSAGGNTAGVGYDLATGRGSWSYTPGAPTLSATHVGDQISLSWTAPTGAAVSGYELLRGTSSGAESATPLATPSGSSTTYTDTSATPGTTYYYELIAQSSAGAGPLSDEVSAAPLVSTTTTLAASANPAGTGQAVTYTATVSPTPSGGTVAFDDGGTPITGCAASTLNGGTATCQTTYASVSSHTITAVYSGNSGFAGSASTGVAESIEIGTTTTLAASTNPATTGQQISYTATVSPAPSSGTIGFFDGGTAIGGCTSVGLNGATATCTVSYAAAATHTITATYPGNGVDAGSTSSALSETVTAPSSGGGGGGGGGGSDGIAISISPASQTVTSGGTATWTVTVTNTGGGYLFNVATTDPSAPNCVQGYGQFPSLQNYPPNNPSPVTFTCTLSGVTSSMTNTVTDSGVGGDGATVTASASASVTVTGAAPAPTAPTADPAPARTPQSSTDPPKTTTAPTVATVTPSAVAPILLDKKHPTLTLTTKVSKKTTLTLVLRRKNGKTLATWTVRLTAGTHKLSLVVPLKARKAGHDTLRITAAGGKTKTVSIVVRAR